MFDETWQCSVVFRSLSARFGLTFGENGTAAPDLQLFDHRNPPEIGAPPPERLQVAVFIHGAFHERLNTAEALDRWGYAGAIST